MRIQVLLLLSLLSACAGTGAPTDPGERTPPVEPPPCALDRPDAPVLAFINAHLVAMDAPRSIEDAVVVVRDGRIEAAGAGDDVAVPEDAVVVDVCGRSILPGLADMHVHLNSEDLSVYPAWGITTVRNMWGFPNLLEWRRQIEAGSRQGPSIHVISPGLDGPPQRWPLTQFVHTPEQADAVVAEQQAGGYTSLKVYQDLRLEVYDAIVASAKTRGMTFEGHVPTAVSLEHALEAGQRSIEHLGGFDKALNRDGARGGRAWADIDVARIPQLAELAAQHQSWVSPTLSILNRISGSGTQAEDARANRGRMVLALHRAGVGLLVGTDAGIDVVPPGATLHEELAELVAAGLSPYDALLGATRRAADYLDSPAEFGTVTPGRRADLLILDADPLADIANTRRIAGVLMRGDWVEPVAGG